MHNVLNPRPHGYIDYAVVALLALAPTLFGFSETPSLICYALAGIQLMMSVLTAYPLGLIGLIPFTVHGMIEAVTAIGVAAMPWIAGFDHEPAARNFFLFSAVSLAAVYFLTNYKAAPAPRRGMRSPSMA